MRSALRNAYVTGVRSKPKTPRDETWLVDGLRGRAGRETRGLRFGLARSARFGHARRWVDEASGRASTKHAPMPKPRALLVDSCHKLELGGSNRRNRAWLSQTIRAASAVCARWMVESDGRGRRRHPTPSTIRARRFSNGRPVHHRKFRIAKSLYGVLSVKTRQPIRRHRFG